MRTRFVFLLLSVLLMPVPVVLAQNANQAAVDTLAKDVAIAVFSGINQPKARAIYVGLLACGDGCDPQQVIRSVGSWDQVGEKMQELATIKNTARFAALAPAAANAAIRTEFNRFFGRYRANASYGKPLNPATRTQILAKIDALLPPAPAPPAATTAVSPGATATGPDVDVDTSDGAGTGINPALYRYSKLERQLKEQQEQFMWMMIVCGGLGLVLGALLVYLTAYRRLKNRLSDLLLENQQLHLNLETGRSQPASRSSNVVRQAEPTATRPEPRSRPAASPSPEEKPAPYAKTAEPRPVRPSAPVERPPDNSRSSSPVAPVEPAPYTQPAPEPVQQPKPVPAPKPVAQDRVFYCPPPDPSGLFDANQQSAMLSPESAYRFSIRADQPTVASFRFEAEPGRLPRLLTYRNYMIEPACESENSYSASYTRVLMRRDGEAVFDNGNWRVKTRALIRYE